MLNTFERQQTRLLYPCYAEIHDMNYNILSEIPIDIWWQILLFRREKMVVQELMYYFGERREGGDKWLPIFTGWFLTCSLSTSGN